MKVVVIIALSLSIISSFIGMYKATDGNEEISSFIGTGLRFIFMILALIFTCVGWK